ncbi:hypothetical protein GDO81_010370 [Engystomops pustulosus]|uniref:Uncharacterized protein n=1 Tax=Engystomops pustulosus TaxID=76066 RepID=A0AAV7BZD2_ENGPU|nr:hypothetical protein GDO81_010370 [Engystomops pustulosus]
MRRVCLDLQTLWITEIGRFCPLLPYRINSISRMRPIFTTSELGTFYNPWTVLRQFRHPLRSSTSAKLLPRLLALYQIST